MTWNFGIGPLDLWPSFWSQGQRSRSRSKFWPFLDIATPLTLNNLDEQLWNKNELVIHAKLCQLKGSPCQSPLLDGWHRGHLKTQNRWNGLWISDKNCKRRLTTSDLEINKWPWPLTFDLGLKPFFRKTLFYQAGSNEKR